MKSYSQDKNTQPKTCIIIGGGISGLVAGTMLQQSGIHVTILDKGRGVGGRLATRRMSHPLCGEGVFDYGAQFFTVSDPRFQHWIDLWRQQGVVREWSSQFSPTGEPCYRGLESNRSIARHLAKNLAVHTQTRVTGVAWNAPHWTVQTENGSHFQAETVLITSPIPQTLALLNGSAVGLPTAIRHRLEAVIYHRCIAVLALLSQPSLIPEPGGLRLHDSPLAWIACNQKKGISPQGAAVTLQATSEFSQTEWKTDDFAIADKLFNLASPWLGSTVTEYQVHRWRYSQPKTIYGASYLAIREPGLLVMAGDAFSSTQTDQPSLNLERATLSGLEAANYLKSY